MSVNNFLSEPNEWQFVDPEINYIFPWYTLPFLEELNTWNLSDLVVLEIGGGSSTLWWAKKCKHVTMVEVHQSWIDRVEKFANLRNIQNIEYNCAPPVGHFLDAYMEIFERDTKYDIIIADGSYRNEVCEEAPKHLKKGGKIIADNYMQEGVWMPHQLDEKLKSSGVNVHIYPQSPLLKPNEHPWIWPKEGRNRQNLIDGHPHWKTAYWEIN